MTNQHTDECAYGLHNTGADGFCKKCGLGTNTNEMREYRVVDVTDLRALKEKLLAETAYYRNEHENRAKVGNGMFGEAALVLSVEKAKAHAFAAGVINFILREGKPLEQAATASADAKYLPVIEKLVGAAKHAWDALAFCWQGEYVGIEQQQEAQETAHMLDEALALAAPLLKGEK